MARVPFTVDPAPEAGANPETPEPGSGQDSSPWRGAKETVWTVSQLTRKVRQLLEGELPTVAVEGEVSNFKAAASGHFYFNLKDRDAQIRCVMFRSAAQAVRFRVEDGLQLVARGRLTVYEQRGEYQIQVQVLEPVGTGALQLAFEQLKAKLEAEGLFAPEAKQGLPFLPRRIGIVTSPTGAAIRDMLHVLERRFPGMPVLLAPARVQGEGAAEEIAEAIRQLNQRAVEQKIDVLIVGRGGGSVEDLWAFNEESVARAIFDSKVPVVSAVGHETDFTIADFVADVRAPTPSAAAEIAVPNRADLLYTVRELRGRLFRRLGEVLNRRLETWEGLRARLGSPETALAQASQRTDEFRERLGLAMVRHHRDLTARQRHAHEQLLGFRPDRLIPLYRREVRALERRITPALHRHVAHLRERLGAVAELLDSLSPLTVLRRGYAIAQKRDGTLLRSVTDVAAGDTLNIKMPDGSLEGEVRSIRRDEDPPR